MALKSWSFEWQGHLLEIDWFEDNGFLSLWMANIGRLRIDGKKVDEQKKITPWPFNFWPRVPILVGQIEGDDGKLHLVKVEFGGWTPCRVAIDGEKVFKSD
jgi:hypothetical protein